MRGASKHVAEGKCLCVKSKLVVAFLVVFGLASVGFAQQASQPIVPDGNTQTSLSTTGSVTNITTSTVSGNNAYNSFSVFNVNQNNVVNLLLPNNTSNLLNLVNSQAVNIDGLLNAIQNGKVGGNVFFADPFGIFVGKTGVVNVGLFTALTPTTDFMNQFFTSPGVPSSGATAAMLNGTVPISPSGLISIQGTVNAIGNVGLYGGAVSNSGVIQSGAVFSGSSSDFSDVVNTNGLQSGTSIAVQNGDIVIQAAGDVDNAGSIATNGGNNLNAGNINVQAGGNITLDSGSLISASGSGQNSNGGNINIFGAENGDLSSGAAIAANGGDVSGNGGTIDFSAKGTVTLAGGTLEAGAVDGTGGTATVDPSDITISGINSAGKGTDLNYTATNSITVDPNAIILSRQISTLDFDAGNFLNAVSTGDSTNITLTAPTITVGDGSEILANATGGYTPGDITMTASQSVTDGLLPPLPTIAANANINIGNATISGGNISITADAEADADKTPNSVANGILDNFSVGNFVGSYGPVSWKAADATSGITIGNSGSSGTASITGSGNVTISSTAGATAVSSVIGDSGFAYGSSTSSATTTVASNATVSAASGALAIGSTSNNTLNVKESTTASSPGIIAIAYGNANSASDTEIDGSVSGSTVNISATNNNNFETQAIAKPFSADSNGAPVFGGGMGIALGSYQSTATTNVPGSVTSNLGDATISSNSTDLQDAVFASSAVNTDGKLGSDAANVQSFVQNFGNFLSQGTLLPNSVLSTGQGAKIGVAASVAYMVGSNSATTTVTGNVDAAKNANITSNAQDAPQVAAPGSVSGQTVDFGGSVSVANFSNKADTSVTGGADVNSLAGSISITSNATMVDPAVNRVNLIHADQNFSNTASGFSSVLADIGTLVSIVGNPGEFTTSFVNSGITTQADASGVQEGNYGFAGSVSVLGLTNKSSATVTGAGTSVLAGYNPDGTSSTNGDGNVNIEADSSITSFNVAGTAFSIGQGFGILNPGVDSGSSLGGSANVVNVTNHSTAEVGDWTTVKALTQVDDNKGQVSVTSNTQTLEAALAQAGGKAESFGVNGTIDYLNLTDSSKGYIQSNATVAATNDVDVNATNDLLDFAVGGAMGLGGSKQLDVAVNWNQLNQTTLADIGDQSNTRTGACTSCGVTAGGNVNVDANSSEDLYALTLAAASSDNPLPTISAKSLQTATNGAGGGAFSFGASGEVAINQAGSSPTDFGIVTKAFINNGPNVTATSGDVNVDANDSSKFVNAALAGSFAGGEGTGFGAALAGAYDQNTISKDVEAFTAYSVINGGGLNIDATGGNNLYAVTAGGAVDTMSTSGALAGEVNNNTIYNNVSANLGAGTSADGIGGYGVTVEAQEGADTIASAAGGFAGGSTGGVGAAVDVGNYNNTVNASIGGNVSTTGNIKVTSKTKAQYFPVAVSFAAGKTFGASGSVAVESITDKTTSSVGGTVSAGENLLVGSKDSSSATMIAGGGAIGGTLGVGVSALLPDFTRTTTASILDNATVSAPGSDAAAISYDNQNDVGILLDASTSGDLQDYVVGGAGSKAIALGGALIVNQPNSKSLNDTTSATIGKDAQVNKTNTGAAADQSVSLLADDNSNILDVAGMLAIGANAGVGVGYDQTKPVWNVSTSIGSGSTVNAKGNVVLDSSLENSINSYAIVGAASLGQFSASVTGATSVINETSNVDSTVNGTVHAGGSVEVAADRNTSSLYALDGNAAVAISFGAGLGVSLADITTNDTVDASIGGTGDVTALGNDSLTVPDGSIDSSRGKPGTKSFRGVSVTAMSFMSSNPITAGVAGSGIVGGQGSVLKDSYTETTKAHVDSGAKVNQTNDSNPNASQSVQVLASDKTRVTSIAGGLSLGSLALTASVDNETLNRNVDAYITGANVDAADNVLVRGSMFGIINSTTVAGSLGAFTGDGAVSNIKETTDTESYVNGGSVVTANGNVEILANRSTSVTTTDGSGVAGAAGANASHSIVNKNDTVDAYVDGSTTSVTALGLKSGLSVPVDNSGSLAIGTVNGLTVAATAKENLNTNAIGASVTLSGGGTGSITTNNVTENTSAKVKGGATINGDNTGADSSQGVNVLASDQTTLTNADGAYGTSFVGAGIGEGVDTTNFQKTTVAGIGNNSTVNAEGAVNVDALSLETIKSHVAAVGGALSAGVAGTKVDDSSHPIKTTTTAYVGSCTTSNNCSGGATVKAGGLGVDSNENLTLNVTTGELSAGGVAIGAGKLNVTVDGNTSAYIGGLSSITVNPGGVNVTSTFGDTLTGKARAGSGSMLGSGEAAHASIIDNSNNAAYVAGQSTIKSYGGGNLTVKADTTRSLSATAKGLAVSGLVGAGGATAHTTTGGTTKAYLGNQEHINTNFLNVDAIDNSNLTSSTTALAAGIGSGTSNDSTADMGDSVLAFIGNQSNITAYGILTVEGASTYNVNSTSSGNLYGGVTGGEDDAEASASPTIDAYIGDSENIKTPNGSLNVDAYNGYNPVTSGSGDVTANATTTNGSIVGGIGSTATATAAPTVNSYIGDSSNSSSSTVSAGKNLTIKSISDPTVSSTADATVYAVGVDASVGATSNIDNNNTASTGPNVTLNAGNITVDASSTTSDQSTVKGGYGALFGGSGDTANTNLTDDTIAEIGQDDVLTAADTGTVLVQSLANDLGYATSHNNIDGLIGSPVTTADVTDGTGATTLIGTGAEVNGGTVNLNAKVTGLDLQTDSKATASAADANATANTTLGGTATPQVYVDDNAAISGNNINMTASLANVDADTSAVATVNGLTGTATANGYNSLLVNPTVYAASGSNFYTNNLTVNSVLPLGTTAEPLWNNTTTENNNTVTGVVTGVLVSTGNSIVNGVTNAANDVASGINSVGNSIGSFFDPPPSGLTTDNTIDFNGTIGVIGAAPATLTIGPDGNVIEDTNVPAPTTTSTQVVVPNIVNNLQNNINFNVAGGTLNGNMTINEPSSIPSVNITNQSNLGLVINGIQPYSNNNNQPVWTVTANIDNSTVNVNVNDNPTAINIQNLSGSDLTFSGFINNPIGSLLAFDQGGNIAGTSGNILKDISTELEAPSGSIGSGANPLNIQMPNDLSNSQGLVVPSLAASAGQDIYANVDAVQDLSSTPSSTPDLTANLNSIQAGGAVDLTLQPGQVFVSTASSGIAGFGFTTSTVAGNATYNLNGTLMAGGAANINDMGGSLYSSGSGQIIQADGISLQTPDGQIGTSSNPINIDLTGGTVSSTAKGDVNLNETADLLNVGTINSITGDAKLTAPAGGVNLGTISSISGDTSITALGSILNGSNPTGDNIIANNITLSSANGSIGMSSAPLTVDNRNPETITGTTPDGSNYLDMTAQGGIYANETSGNLLSHGISSTAENIDLLASDSKGGNGDLAQIVGNQNVTVDVTGSLLNINDITGSADTSQKTASPNDVSLSVLTAGGTLNVNHMDVYQSVTTRADNTNLFDVIHTNLADPQLDTYVQSNALHFDDQGATGGIANSIDINVSPCSRCTAMPAVIFDNYLTQTGTVNANVEWLEFVNAIVGKQADFQNNWLNILLNNSLLGTKKAYTSWYLFMIGNNFAAQNAFSLENETFDFLQPGLQPTYAQPIGTIETDLLTSYGFLQ